MKKLFFRFFKLLQQLTDFHQPGFRHFDCIDLVLENKILLLLSWDAVHTSKICIYPGKIIYRRAAGAVVCRLSPGADSVDVILHNIWRSKKISFRLTRITVDQQMLQYLDEHFLTGLISFITGIHIDFIIPVIRLNKLHPQLRLETATPLFDISINQLQLNDYVS